MPASGPGLSVLYRDISRKQYIASFGLETSENIAIPSHIAIFLRYFLMHDIGQFWPFMDL